MHKPNRHLQRVFDEMTELKDERARRQTLKQTVWVGESPHGYGVTNRINDRTFGEHGESPCRS